MDNFKKTISQSIRPKERSAVAIDFGISSVKVVQLRKEHGKAILETYGELACGPYNDLAVGQATPLSTDKYVELIRDLFKEANVTAKIGAIAIPLSHSLIVSAEIPEIPEARLPEVIPLEARKYVPVPISEVILDWWVVPRSQSDFAPAVDASTQSSEEVMSSTDGNSGRKMEVLIASIHKDSVREYQSIVSKLNLQVDAFEIETFSSIRSVMPNDLSATAILDIGAGSAKIAIVDYGIVRLSHTIPKGSQDITVSISKSLSIPFAKAEEVKRRLGLVGDIEKGDLVEMISPTVEYIFAEANKTMVKYQKEHKRSINKVVLIGGGATLKGILDIARGIMGVPVVLGLPFDKVEAPAFLNNVLKEAGPEFAVAIGLALRKLEDL
ncbi:MAG TPA: pilus assembly protein PilM [Candidatus Paceibacterota bacterium]|nr:pilus assembly protein PilM [Candidatus Paceibacterota bacterium]